MSDLLSQTYFWIFLLLAMFGSANTTTKQWAKAQLDDTPIFQTMFYQFYGNIEFCNIYHWLGCHCMYS